MDECRFDNWTKILAVTKDRRSGVRSAIAAGAALFALARSELGLAQESDILAEGCKLSGESCKHNNQCCSKKCKRHRRRKRDRNRNDGGKKKRRRKDDGVCLCRGNGSPCRKDAACCRGFCSRTDFRCRCVPRNDACTFDSDCCDGVCETDDQGNKFCKRGRRNRRRKK